MSRDIYVTGVYDNLAIIACTVTQNKLGLGQQSTWCNNLISSLRPLCTRAINKTHATTATNTRPEKIIEYLQSRSCAWWLNMS